jgi:hypothetical protein
MWFGIIVVVLLTVYDHPFIHFLWHFPQGIEKYFIKLGPGSANVKYFNLDAQGCASVSF